MMTGCAVRLAYLTVTNTFAVVRLLPNGDRDKDTEIVVLRHQIAVLERQLGGPAADRAFYPRPGATPGPGKPALRI
jgi:hypothetical protein